MAEVVEIDIPGIGKIEAKNAATEATLKELVNAIKGLEKTTNKNAKDQAKAAKDSGKSSGGGAGPDMGKMGRQTNEATKNMASLNRAGRVAASSFTMLGKVGMSTSRLMGDLGTASGNAARMADNLSVRFMALTGSITNMIDDIAGMGDNLSSAAKSLRNIPVVGGMLASTLGAAASAAAGVADSFQKASSVGATFGGSVNEMSRAASGAGMTLDQFAGLLASNGESLMLLGGTTEAGAKRFSELTKVMRSSGVNDELLRMGYSTKDINQGIMNYAASMSRTGHLQRMTTAQIAAESGKYMKQIDALARATGQQREEVQRQADALRANAKVQTALAQIQDPEQRRKMEAYILSFPKEAQGAIADMIATGNMSTEEAVKLGVMLPGVAKDAMNFGRTLQNGGKINDQMINNSLNNAAKEGQKAIVQNRTLGLYVDEFSNATLAAGALASRSQDAYIKSQKDQAEATRKANMAEEVEKAKQKLAEISNSFMLFLANSGAINTLMSAFQAFTSFAEAVLMPAFSMITSAINTLTPIIADTVIPVFQVLGNWISTAIIPIFETMGNIISSTVGAIFDFFGITSAASDGLGVFEEILYTVSDFIADNLEPILVSLATIAVPMVIGKIAGLVLGLKAMTVNVYKNVAGLIAMSIPFIKLIAIGAAVYLAFKGLQFVIEKVRGSFDLVKNTMTIVFSHIKTMLFTVFKGILSLINKIPGFRGDFDDAIKGLDEKISEESETRSKAEQDIRNSAEKQRQAEAAAKKAEENREREKEQSREERAAARKEAREKRSLERKERAEKDAIKERREEEKAAASEDDTAATDLTNPIAMLRSFAEKNKSAFTEEAKALDQVDAARKEVVAANKAYNDAEEAVRKAKNDDEKKAAEEALAAAKERRNNAMKAESEADKTAISAAARMKAAREGRDTGLTKQSEERRSGGAAGQAAGTAPALKDLGDRFGRVAAHFEAAGNAGTVSTGHGDHGGKSYGAFQLASNTGDVDKFLKSSGFADAFKGMKVGSKEFDAKWKEMAKNKDFVDAQYAHAKKSHYDPQMAKLSKSGLDLSGRGMGVQEAIMSTANQYGANTDVIIKALKDKDVSKMDDKEIINAIQDYKASTVERRFRSSSAAVRAGVAKRIEQERTALLGIEGGAMPQTATATATPTDQRGRGTGRAQSSQAAMMSGKPVADGSTVADNMKAMIINGLQELKVNGNVTIAGAKNLSSGASDTSFAANVQNKLKTAFMPPSVSQLEQSIKDQEAKKESAKMSLADVAITKDGKSLKPDVATTPATAQETPESLLSSLNMKMDELIRINRESVDISGRQLSVTRNNSGDLFA
jgi:hypothetical protein